ncbi:hypothetical protein B0H13DRAFT_2389394 [Mycena leptocephala]|nr:hypothetical protein B0H13DRAFT_2389394 [Mycena leptocephala]
MYMMGELDKAVYAWNNIVGGTGASSTLDQPAASMSSADDGAFNVDSFLHSVATHEVPLSSLILPEAAPSASRSLRNATDKSFNSRTGTEKSKTKSRGALDGMPKGFLETDLLNFSHFGLHIPCATDTAAKFREKMTENEIKLVTYHCSQEHVGNKWRKDMTGQHEQLAQIDPKFIAVHNAVSINRKAINDVHDALPTTAFYNSVQEMRDEIDTLSISWRGQTRSCAIRSEIAAMKATAHSASTYNQQTNIIAAPVEFIGGKSDPPTQGQKHQAGGKFGPFAKGNLDDLHALPSAWSCRRQ